LRSGRHRAAGTGAIWQTGTTDWSKLEENEKVRIAHNGQLKKLARELTNRHNRPCGVDSFILLRDSSLLGQIKGQVPTQQEEAEIEKMQAKHVLRLDWHTKDEMGNTRSGYWNGKSYLDSIRKVFPGPKRDFLVVRDNLSTHDSLVGAFSGFKRFPDIRDRAVKPM